MQLNQYQKTVLRLRKNFDSDLIRAATLFSSDDILIPCNFLAGLILCNSKGNKYHREFNVILYEKLSEENPIAYGPDLILASWNHGAAAIPGFYSNDMVALRSSTKHNGGVLSFSVSDFYTHPATALASYLMQVADLRPYLKAKDFDPAATLYRFHAKNPKNKLIDAYLEELKGYMLIYDESIRAIPDVRQFLLQHKEIIL